MFLPHPPKPRNVTPTEAEKTLLFNAAAPNLKCWLLMCSDLAIRSGTAARLGPANYDRQRNTLSFVTKFNNTQTIAVTKELAALFDGCHDSTLPFTAQLPRGFHPKTGRELPPINRMTLSGLNTALQRLKKKLSIKRRITPHDFRRTTARKVYDATLDLRVAQAVLGHTALRSTLWYLQAELQPVPVETLELVKLNSLTERTQ